MNSDKDKHLLYLNALNCVSVLGPRRISALVKSFETAEAAWAASPEQYPPHLELQKYYDRIKKERSAINPDQEWERLEKSGVQCITPDCHGYPGLLHQVPLPPPLLYYRGSLDSLGHPAVAIVGSRRCTFYGNEVAGRLAAELASAGVGVISGMALGVDTAAHRGALENGGYTAAVLGCGLGRCYPPRNRELMEELAAAGAVISEFSLMTEPHAVNFPQRNRVISGLSLGTVVVEATEKSGALITAGYALEQNREVFAVPGNIGSPYSRGCHRLLKEGAKLVESVEDILDELYIGTERGEQLSLDFAEPELSDPEKLLLDLLPYQPMHIDKIIQLSSMSVSEASALLLALEIRGLIKQTPGKYFCRS
jgi:DNA processing protein